MSENKHTPEPWRAFNNGQGVVGVSTDRSDVCWTRIEEGGWLDSDRTIDIDYENARRIVACVNACAGIPTELLNDSKCWAEAGVETATSLRKQIATLTRQRDLAVKALRYGRLYAPDGSIALDNINAALSAIKESEQP